MSAILQAFFSLLLAVSFWFGVCLARAEASIGGDFSLTDQDGRSFQLQQLRGKVVLLFFGYTLCPDICPTELAKVSALLNTLQDAAEQVRGVFVTVDPERDTPQALKRYVGYFNSQLIGLTGSLQEIGRVAEQYRVNYGKNLRSDGGYSIDHSANLFVIDRAGHLSSVVPYGLPPDHVLEVVQRLLAGDD